MRSLLVAVVAGIFAGSLSAGETYPKKVKLPEQAEVRGAPSKDAIATSRLDRGTEVLVLRAAVNHPDWLEIQPPRGSYSWIPAEAMKKVWNGKLGFIEGDPDRPVKIFAGSMLVNSMPEAVVAEVVDGTIVSIIERPLTVQGKTWYPIEPLSHEVRYLHKSQLGFGSAENKIIATPSAADEIMALRQRIEDLEKRIKQLEKRKKKKQP